MEAFFEHINQPFYWGLFIGLALAFFAWKSGLSNKMRLSRDVRRLENELRELQGHLNTQLKINAQGNKQLEVELDELRKQNENLRVSLAANQNKPGRAELRQYQVIELAVRHMREHFPNFAPTWEKALQQAETEVEASENGFKRLVRRVMPGIGMSGAAPAHSGNDKDED